MPHLGDPKDTLGLEANMLEIRLFIFTATGWIQPVEGPEHDGAYQLNVPRLQRLLDAAEAAMATGEPDVDTIAEADRELPGECTVARSHDRADEVETGVATALGGAETFVHIEPLGHPMRAGPMTV
ncbi:hypothetical protein SAMN05444817_1129 [Corynebacterium appendicis CIP 107643]|uniref:Uncharacterized protein n=2 Tax=Corynebacterium appendicis TaxID=163202 RepID=A0A1N7JX97_9CORY|nr:hypothetical protein CAPP_03295 [Corynebacterium appendicis CIP 107643]SIS53950.1 hypothetical protein SAMN05444817_1129 [Corynebacterium appendicis CIP 107643]